jgi:hypothetical protein
MQFPGFGMMTCTAIDSCDPWQVRKALHVDVPAKMGRSGRYVVGSSTALTSVRCSLTVSGSHHFELRNARQRRIAHYNLDV